MPSSRTFSYVIGTRPNFMKMAPVLAGMRARCPDDRHVLIHTGQHYDDAMSAIFVDQLDLPEPDVHLEVGSGPHGAQTGRLLAALEGALSELSPAGVVVSGDVNSTLAAALAAAKLGVRIAHVESGLRSFDRTMPEEINRVIADQLSDVLFTHTPEALDNLVREGVDPARVHQVGNTMIDTLVRLREVAAGRAEHVLGSLGVEPGRYVLVTLHRPALVDDGGALDEIMDALEALSTSYEVVFPMHPRTRAALGERLGPERRVRVVPPVGYLEFLLLQERAAAVLTDSGGVQEETTFLGVPCYTLRANTERPITLSHGTNTLLGVRPDRIRELPDLIASARDGRGPPPAGWDGRAGLRAAAILDEVWTA